METILIIFLSIITLYLIFQHRCIVAEVNDLHYQIDKLKSTSLYNSERIRKLEIEGHKSKVDRRKHTDKYSRILKTTISKSVVYCNNGWSVSKTLLTKVKGKAYRIFEGGIRPSYIRAKRWLLWFVYRIETRQKVLSYCRTKAIYIKGFGQGVLRYLCKRFQRVQRTD